MRRSSRGTREPRVDAVIEAPDDKVVVLSHFRLDGAGARARRSRWRWTSSTPWLAGQIIRIEGYYTREEALEAAGLRK